MVEWDTLFEGDRETFKECFVQNIGADETTIIRTLTLGVYVHDDIETILGLTNLPIFLRKTPLPSRMDLKTQNLVRCQVNFV